MTWQCRSIDSDLREYLLSVGRIALICGLFLIPFRSTEASAEAMRYEHGVSNQLVWWAPEDQLTSCPVDVRDGLTGPAPVVFGPFASEKLRGNLSLSELRADAHLVGSSLVELRVRLQV